MPWYASTSPTPHPSSTNPTHHAGCHPHVQARLASEAEAAAAAEERLTRVIAALERCRASATDLDRLADAYGDLQVTRAWMSWSRMGSMLASGLLSAECVLRCDSLATVSHKRNAI